MEKMEQRIITDMGKMEQRIITEIKRKKFLGLF